jgi:SAM-dependent methyltransferase
LPEWHYIGIDVGDYNQSRPDLADEYIVVSPEQFNSEIARQKDAVDAVISSHNLEHCYHRRDTVRFMAQALRPGGKLYISFPCQKSTSFPGRAGCLNYYDDCTHQGNPPSFSEVISIFHAEGLQINFATTQYQPPIGWLLGLQQEKYSRETQEVKLGTWWFWGFESVIWAERPLPSSSE